eukprot:TRINITY_DN44736_c0_g1_i1.p1 TRINITY_DN44736_c0_g1~~TRINITY_DN44736_c0_g1_i1.p1  ORF type:complete len:542 (-),score=113.93 TRINITY_DN44736_c0_g1_i1:133-1758(-)
MSDDGFEGDGYGGGGDGGEELGDVGGGEYVQGALDYGDGGGGGAYGDVGDYGGAEDYGDGDEDDTDGYRHAQVEFAPQTPEHEVERAPAEEWNKLSIRPENQEKWMQRTCDSLNHARLLSRHAMRHCVDSDNLHVGSSKKGQQHHSNVQTTIKKKMGMTEDLIRALEDRVESVDDSIRQVGESLFSLQRAHRSKWAPLNICERRLELREGRPLQELVRDHCQDALEHERQTLIESRQELADQIESSKEMLVNLEGMRNALMHDVQHKRHALRLDRSCLAPHCHKTKFGERVVLPHLQDVANYGIPPSPKNSEKATGPQNETKRIMDARQLITAAVHLEEDAIRLCNASDAAMIHTKRECNRASSLGQTALTRRVDETGEMKRQLEVQISETDETIALTEISLAKTKKQLESHDTPLRVLDKQFSHRNKRTSREGIRDHVHEEMETHFDGVKKSVRTLAGKWQHTKEILDQLRAAKLRMTDDYRCKLHAWKIDDSCMKVTARKAIELDRMDPRGGRCMKPAGSRRAPPRPEFADATYGTSIT